jgi:hypothetical protein
VRKGKRGFERAEVQAHLDKILRRLGKPFDMYVVQPTPPLTSQPQPHHV